MMENKQIPMIIAFVLAVVAVAAAAVILTGHGDSGKEYTVTFDPNGETFDEAPGTQKVRSGDLAKSPGTVLNSDGSKTVDGWYTDKQCTQQKWDFGSGKVTSDLRLYAHWISAECTVTLTSDPLSAIAFTYSIDGGTQMEYAGPITVKIGSTLSATAAVGTDYRFKEWDDGTGTATRTATISGTAEWTAYARTPAFVTFHYDGEDTVPAYRQEFDPDKEFTLEANRFTAPEGKVFGWWSVNFLSGDLEFYDGQKVVVDEDDPIDVYAVWATVETLDTGNKAYLYQAQADGGTVGLITGAAELTQAAEGKWAEENSVTELSIGCGIPSVGEAAFKYNTLMRSLNVIDGVTAIGQNAFDTCFSLQYVWLGDSVKTVGGYAFNGCTQLEFLIMSAAAETIGDHAFHGCIELGDFILPATLKSIGESAFYECHAITAIDIPSGISVIQRSTFSHCHGLTSVTLPDTVKEIGASAFSDCPSITGIGIPAGVTKIGNSAFASCVGLQSIDLPSGITELGMTCFYRCTGLTSVTVPSGVTKIGNGAFSSCTGLMDVSIPQTVTSIGSAAFNGCPSITRLVFEKGFPGCNNQDNMFLGNYSEMFDGSGRIKAATDSELGYTYFGDYSTWEAIGTDTITFHDGDKTFVEKFKKGTRIMLEDNTFEPPAGKVFGWWTSDTSTNSFRYYDQQIVKIDESSVDLYAVWADATPLEDGNTGLLCRTGTDTIGLILGSSEVTDGSSRAWVQDNSVTSLVIGGGVPSVGDGAFDGCRSLKSVVLDEGVGQIGSTAFYQCQISDLNMGGVTTVGISAFNGCQLLKNIAWGTSLTDIGAGAFSGCVSLAAVSLPGKVVSIGDNAFRNCSGLTSAVLGDKVEDIGKEAFSGCGKLASVNFPASLASVGSSVFKGCISLTAVNLSAAEKLTELPYGMFSGCVGITSVTLQATLTAIGDSVFAKCSFTSIVLPSTIVSIGDSAFSSTKLTSFNVPTNEQFTKISATMLMGCEGLTSITIPNNITVVDRGAFSQCVNLATVVMGSSVTEIGNSAFNNTQITSITLPVTLKTVGDWCFQGCKELTSVTIPAGMTGIGYKAFFDCGKLTTVVLKAGLNQEDGDLVFDGDYSQMVADGRIANLSSTDVRYTYSDGTWTAQ